MNETFKLKNNCFVQIIRDAKFNEVLVNFKLYFNLEAKQNTVANLLTRMMDDRNNVNQTKQDIQRRLDMLYGAKTSAMTYTQGIYQVIDVSVKTLHERFVDEGMLDQQLQLLHDMVFTPLINDDTLREAKSNLKLQHARFKESSARYAQIKAFEMSAPGQTFSLNSIGELTDVDAIEVADVIALHQSLIAEAGKSLTLVGDVTDVPDLSRFEKGMSMSHRDPLLKTRIEPRYKEMTHPGNQTELVLVYETDIDPHHPLYYAYLVFVAYLGQLPTSLLFQNIREKHSLAYSIYASRQVFDGIMFVATGINDENLEKTQTLIHEQFMAMRDIEFPLEAVTNYLSMSISGTTENLKSLADFSFRNMLLDSDETVEDVQAQFMKVTMEDVHAVFDHIHEPFIFAYRGQNNEKN